MKTIQRTRNAIAAFRQRMQAFHVLALCVFLALGSLCGTVHAAVPQTINYQGYLTNPGGTPISSSVVMTFRRYNAASGGAALWTETQLSVNVANGNFNAVLGSVMPLTLPFDVPYWLTVTINSDGEMSPRQPLASSPYTLRAATADTATAATNLTGTIGTTQIASNAVTQAKLSPVSGAAAGKVLGTDGSNLQWQTASAGTLTSVGTGSGLTGGPITGSGTISLATTQLLPAIACTTNQIVKWNGSAWACATVSFVGTDVTVQIAAAAGAVASNSCFTAALGVPGAAVGDVLLGTFVGATPPPASLVIQLLKVTSADQATLRYCNPTNSPSVAFSNVDFRIITFR